MGLVIRVLEDKDKNHQKAQGIKGKVNFFKQAQNLVCELVGICDLQKGRQEKLGDDKRRREYRDCF